MPINPMLGTLARGKMAGMLPQIKRAMTMIRGAQDPEGMIRQMMGNNPQFSEVQKLIQKSGGDPKRAFYALAEQYGVNPEEILRAIR